MRETLDGRSFRIRAARAEDAEAIRRLARGHAPLEPLGATLVGVENGEIRAAVGVRSGRTIADRFQGTQELVELVSSHARRLRAGNPAL